jgi:pimeloyl-ACP methyl ester carboxylesterase
MDRRTPVYAAVDESTFGTLLSHYRYDQQPPNRRVTDVVETEDWTRERFWLDGIDGDSILAYLYLPKSVAPPYQTLILVPNGGAFFSDPPWRQSEDILGPNIKAGRAVFAVVLDGMIERRWPEGFVPPQANSVRFRDDMVHHATELRLGIDYIETREDIDAERLAYVGVSWGGGSRLAFAAVDERYRAIILIGAGIDERIQPTLPEANSINFAPYIRPPKLFLNGRQDEEHSWFARALPLWELLREPKELVLVEGAGHLVPAEQRVPAMNDFLDRILGPVGPRGPN